METKSDEDRELRINLTDAVKSDFDSSGIKSALVVSNSNLSISNEVRSNQGKKSYY